MPKRIKMIVCLLLVALALSGCVMRTVDELYCLPKRSKASNDLQSVIDASMANLTYLKPLDGLNRQTVQPVDLDGDGEDEYVVLAKSNGEEPLKILVFGKAAKGYQLLDTISAYGRAFESVEFCNMDDRPGAEIIVGRQVDTGFVRSVAVYSLYSGSAKQLLETGYTKMLSCDMDSDGRSELMLLGEAGTVDRSCTVSLYRFQDGQMNVSSQYELPFALSAVQNMESVVLHDGVPAMMLSSSDKGKYSLDLFTVRFQRFYRLTDSIVMENKQNQFIYNLDVDWDGDVDFPQLVPVDKTADPELTEKWTVWFDIDSNGQRYTGMHTYFNYDERWYLHLDRTWVKNLTVSKNEGTCTFQTIDGKTVLTIFSISGENRYEQAEQMGVTVLGSRGMVLYVAQLGDAAELFDITENRLPQLFYMIGFQVS